MRLFQISCNSLVEGRLWLRIFQPVRLASIRILSRRLTKHCPDRVAVNGGADTLDVLDAEPLFVRIFLIEELVKGWRLDT